MFKKILAAAIPLLLLAVLIPGSLAQAAPNTTVVFTIGFKTLSVNGQTRVMDAAPFISQNSRTMVPVRFLAQVLGASVNWNAATRTVTLTEGGTTEVMLIGSTTLTVNGQAQTMDTAPQIVPPGRTELPARFVAQAFGYTVKWDATARTVTITNVSDSGTGERTGTGGQTGGQTGTGGQGGGQIGNVPFQPTIASLTETVGSSTATATLRGGGTQMVQLPAAPVLVAPSNAAKQWFLDSANNASLNYNNQDIIVNAQVSYDSIYVPVASTFEAFGVPAANVQWDGSKLTVYFSSNVSLSMTPGSTTIAGSQTKLLNALLVIDGVPMLYVTDAYGFMFGIDQAKDHLLNGIRSENSGEDLSNGSVLINYT